MKGFKKLGLVATAAALPAAAFAMQPMTTAELSQTTAQDGLDIGIQTNNLELGQAIYDRDGIGTPTDTHGLSASQAGVIVIGNNGDTSMVYDIETGKTYSSLTNFITVTSKGASLASSLSQMVINTGGQTIELAVDAGQNTGGAAVLNVGVTIPSGTTIHTGTLRVGTTANYSAAQYGGGFSAGNSYWSINNLSGVVAADSKITLGQTNLNIQLGNVVQTEDYGNGKANPMIALDTSITGGIHIEDTRLYDQSNSTVLRAKVAWTGSSGNWTLTNPYTGSTTSSTATTQPSAQMLAAPAASLFIKDTAIVDGAGATGLKVKAGIDITNQGLAIAIGQLGDGTNGANLYQTRVDLGNGKAIGDVAITGLKLGGTVITISGH